MSYIGEETDRMRAKAEAFRNYAIGTGALAAGFGVLLVVFRLISGGAL